MQAELGVGAAEVEGGAGEELPREGDLLEGSFLGLDGDPMGVELG